MDIIDEKRMERRVIEEVAKATGCTYRAPDDNDKWGDGYLVDDNKPAIAVQVVSAYPDRAEDIPATPSSPSQRVKTLSRWAQEYHTTQKRAQKQYDETGVYPSIGVRDGKGMLSSEYQTPPPVTTPHDHVVGILRAIAIKSDPRKYGRREVEKAILVVHHVGWPLPLCHDDLKRIAEHASERRAPFREIWVVNEFGDPAQRVPFELPPLPRLAELPQFGT